MRGRTAFIRSIGQTEESAKSLWDLYLRRKCIPKYRLSSDLIYHILPIDRPL